MLIIHPIADIFPPMSDVEFCSLKADIAEHGQREPIWLYEGQVIDGRHRLRACDELGREPLSDVYEGSDPIAFIVSLNLHRRHLDESQRGMVAAKIATLPHGVRADQSGQLAGVTQANAAGMLNVGERTVRRAREVIDTAPELVDSVQRGDLSVSLAAEVARLPEREKRYVVEQPATDIRGAALEAVHNHRAQGTGENEWYTPAEYAHLARDVLGTIDLDPASSERANEIIQATQFFSEQDNGLAHEWSGRIWLNPPYSQPLISQFVEKLCTEFARDAVTEAILLTHSYTDTRWFHTAAAACSAICFTKGRVRFVSPDGKLAAPTQGQAFFYFGRRNRKFAQIFSAVGFVVIPEAS